ncbi:LPXTG cell wall anchor domain-containing protein [Enterococcus faecium]|uniref:LPXTG cell wall anchor domain-containing protein n=1 Tax=Enterococcus TaxID=1350 RepID=UPI0019191A42|nr:LPXTG cell wall anchor domain-containing protein [Enterococcus hirae]MCR1913773.1 LPXTG cell wall anchor domain-containing protein [Enterococcus hirae]QQU12272.1 LPXTG cell wall anchor domain-containing protein [Enterococcus hirae]
MKNNVFKLLLTLTLLLSFAIQANVYAEQTSQQTKTELSVMLKRPIAGTPQQIVEGNPSVSTNHYGLLPQTSEHSNHIIFLLGIFIFVLCCLVGLYKKTEKRGEG